MDSTLPMPCDANGYLRDTFRECSVEYESLFRVVPAHEYLDNFASDRSHMLNDALSTGPSDESGQRESLKYHSPVPSYPPISGPGAKTARVRHNLMTDFVDFSSVKYGTVMDLCRFTQLLST